MSTDDPMSAREGMVAGIASTYSKLLELNEFSDDVIINSIALMVDLSYDDKVALKVAIELRKERLKEALRIQIANFATLHRQSQ